MKRLAVYISAMLLTFAVSVIIVSFSFIKRPHAAKEPETQPIPKTDEPPALKPEIAPISYPEASSIRSIDFYNFTYPGSTYGEGIVYYPEQTFTLRHGKWGDWRYGMTLLNVLYGDVTGDGQKEAILEFSQDTDGSAGMNSVYVYTIENGRPKLLWAFTSGDRADGGLRRVYINRGKFVVELYGKETRIEGSSPNFGTESTALCCPKFFTRTSYEWVDGHFEPSGEMEAMPDPAARN